MGIVYILSVCRLGESMSYELESLSHIAVKEGIMSKCVNSTPESLYRSFGYICLLNAAHVAWE